MSEEPQRVFEDVSVGDALADLVKGPLSPAHLMRWSSAIENWHRIHYDRPYAIEHDRLPDILVSGSWKQHVLLQLLSRWAGKGGWAWQVRLQFRAMNVPGEVLTAWGRVAGLQRAGAFGLADLEIGIRNEAGAESTPGSARVLLPVRGGPPVPRPFTPDVVPRALR
ncbi:acyl dehydratase [Afifella sp. IM 167]|uniref:acyl dehydratase n=1 Tax=Afifella sp. IM 167 TaxID=2033586 RepID=UPI001CCD63A4|nr:acyl dehydratase [Afifella sp. IM 167]MBZ8134789.1 acyl dehydratase [Afifella sp. IM 167]